MKFNIGAILIAIASIVFVSCTKEANVVETEKRLAPLSLSGFGLLQQTSPFNKTDVIKLSFNATTTNTQPGSFDLAFYDTTDSDSKKWPKVATDSIHFDSWSGTDVTKAYSIAYTTMPTTYPNTTIYNGSISFKPTAKLLSGKKYAVIAYARSADKIADKYTPNQIRVNSLITIK